MNSCVTLSMRVTFSMHTDKILFVFTFAEGIDPLRGTRQNYRNSQQKLETVANAHCMEMSSGTHVIMTCSGSARDVRIMINIEHLDACIMYIHWSHHLIRYMDKIKTLKHQQYRGRTDLLVLKLDLDLKN